MQSGVGRLYQLICAPVKKRSAPIGSQQAQGASAYTGPVQSVIIHTGSRTVGGSKRLRRAAIREGRGDHGFFMSGGAVSAVETVSVFTGGVGADVSVRAAIPGLRAARDLIRCWGGPLGLFLICFELVVQHWEQSERAYSTCAFCFLNVVQLVRRVSSRCKCSASVARCRARFLCVAPRPPMPCCIVCAGPTRTSLEPAHALGGSYIDSIFPTCE